MYVRKTTIKKQPKVNLNSCEYSPVKPNTLQMKNSTVSITSPHEYCLHNHYCIFNENRHNLETQITQLEKQLKEFKEIKENAINGEIIYHDELDPYYITEHLPYTGIDGKKHIKIDVTTTDKFINAINTKIKNLEYDLRNLLKFRLDILHGKIGGYGYGV